MLVLSLLHHLLSQDSVAQSQRIHTGLLPLCILQPHGFHAVHELRVYFSHSRLLLQLRLDHLYDACIFVTNMAVVGLGGFVVLTR